jgi:hypothetical protein
LAGNQHFDRQWQEGVRQVTLAFEGLPPELRERLGLLAADLKTLKESLQQLVEPAGAAQQCAECGGACCRAGKYHFSRVDLLIYLVDGKELFEPLFGNGLCPYLAPQGCLIPVSYRPFNCITFNCERIEDLLPEVDVTGFYRKERELRRLYGEIHSLFPDHAMYGAVLADSPNQTSSVQG